MSTNYSYIHVHKLLRKLRGPAKEHLCECGSPAVHWAYQHTGNTLYQEVVVGRKPRAYSADIYADYAPMCRPCHVRLDHEHDPEWRDGLSARMKVLGQMPKDPKHLHAAGVKGGTAAAASRRADPQKAEAHASRARKNAVAARAALAALPPERMQEVREAQRRGGLSTRGTHSRRECLDCGKISHPAGIGSHQKHSEHTGYKDLEN